MTESYLRVVLSIQILLTRSRYDAAAFGDVGPAVDVWAWGCVVLQCLTNAEPWAVSDIPPLYVGASHSYATHMRTDPHRRSDITAAIYSYL